MNKDQLEETLLELRDRFQELGGNADEVELFDECLEEIDELINEK